MRLDSKRYPSHQLLSRVQISGRCRHVRPYRRYRVYRSVPSPSPYLAESLRQHQAALPSCRQNALQAMSGAVRAMYRPPASVPPQRPLPIKNLRIACFTTQRVHPQQTVAGNGGHITTREKWTNSIVLENSICNYSHIKQLNTHRRLTGAFSGVSHQIVPEIQP